ncbi:MAG TPA: chemotaxis protein CheW [Mycobacteriales bacterium]|nr:chemotaxis protein CheW [Mycobacteriales bacterium]
MSDGLITFTLGERNYATPLTEVLEVVRLQGLAELPGMAAPLAGVIDLRGAALPVLDLRVGADADSRGDVLVVENDATKLGVAVDRVRAVVERAELSSAGSAAEDGLLPAYVVEVLRDARGPIFLVDLAAMVRGARGAGAGLDDLATIPPGEAAAG